MSRKAVQAKIHGYSRTRPHLANPFIGPRTPLEKELASIWAEVLDIDQVGIYDNFFDLGGHPVLATQLVARILATFQVELSPRTLLNLATVATMTAVIDQSQASVAE